MIIFVIVPVFDRIEDHLQFMHEFNLHMGIFIVSQESRDKRGRESSKSANKDDNSDVESGDEADQSVKDKTASTNKQAKGSIKKKSNAEQASIVPFQPRFDIETFNYSSKSV